MKNSKTVMKNDTPAPCGTSFPVQSNVDRGGATDIKMVRQNRGAAGAEASAEGTRMEAP